jgi:hypothetical protein
MTYIGTGSLTLRADRIVYNPSDATFVNTILTVTADAFESYCLSYLHVQHYLLPLYNPIDLTDVKLKLHLGNMFEKDTMLDPLEKSKAAPQQVHPHQRVSQL